MSKVELELQTHIDDLIVSPSDNLAISLVNVLKHSVVLLVSSEIKNLLTKRVHRRGGVLSWLARRRTC